MNKKNIQIDKVFLGHTPSEQRKFIVYYLKKYISRYPKIHIPCVGEFSLVKCALDAGYKTKDITCSDISLFSGLLANFFMGKSIFEMKFKVSDRVQKEMDEFTDEVDKLAVLLFNMRIHQYRDYFFDQVKKDNIVENRNFYIKQIRDKVLSMKEVYGGITYFEEDLRDTIIERKDTIMIINPPAFSKGYEKMFDFGKDIEYQSSIPEFSLSKEFLGLFKKSLDIDSPILWYKYRDLAGIDSSHAIFAKEYPKNRFDYWLINNRKFFDERPVLVARKKEKFRPLKIEQFTKGVLKKDSKIKIITMKEEHCLYYRDLWAHKLGATKAEIYLGFLIDGKLFGITGLMLNRARSLQSDEVFENFGFTAPNMNYPTLNRLLMLFLTSTQTRDFIYNLSNKNRIFKIDTFRTTCLSKYRKVKLNNGILNVEKREKQGQFYKIMYSTNFYDRTLSECVELYLDELVK